MQTNIQNKKGKLISWLLIVGLLLFTSLIDLKGILQKWWVDQDKHFHLVIFALFMVVTQLLFKNLSLFKVSLITFALGLLIEILQAFFTHGHRRFDIYDLVFNVIGIALGIIIIQVYQGVGNNKGTGNTALMD